MPELKHRAVDASYLQRPIVDHLVKICVGHQVVVYLRQQRLSWHYYHCLRPANLVVLVFLEAVAGGRDVLEGVEDRDQVGEGLPGPVVGVDDHAQPVEVFLEGDREGLCLHEGGLLEVVLFQQLDDLLLEGEVLELGAFGLRIQIVLP